MLYQLKHFNTDEYISIAFMPKKENKPNMSIFISDKSVKAKKVREKNKNRTCSKSLEDITNDNASLYDYICVICDVNYLSWTYMLTYI